MIHAVAGRQAGNGVQPVVIKTRLQQWEGRAEWALAACAVAFLVLYSIEVLALPSGLTARLISVLLFLLYLPFIADYVVRLALAENRLRWFFTHPLDLAVATLPFLQPLRFLRLVALIRLLQRAFGDVVRGRVLSFITFGGLLLIYSAALAELKYERFAPGSRITNFGDAMRWAVSTLTTVGYGDYVPVTVGGRIIAVLLMVGGISLIGLVTATVAHWMVTEIAAGENAQQTATVEHIEQLQAQIARLEQLVAPQREVTLDGASLCQEPGAPGRL